ncbi:pyocin S6 family toxin immunity protein [Pseudomonas neuropathica]|uniref:Pyocin S6 family toxin immunity protein n=1 Tax=Pseudomonas neuropathica TaxID=2730425 RepID=A0ACC7MQ11_9PSED
MFLEITGFLASGSADSSIKFELDIAQEYEQAVMDVLGWESLAAEADGELPLTSEQVQQIAEAINEQLPTALDLFIGVRA